MKATCKIANEDCIAGMAERVKDNSVHLTVTSIPFEELFTYSGKPEDVGNNGSTVDIRAGRFALNMRFVVDQLLRVTAPGCNVCIHIQQLLAYKNQHGFMGRRDFRGAMVDVFSSGGFNFVGEVAIPKDPQQMAQRLNLHSLQFKTGYARSSTHWAMAPNDYVLIFQKPGEVEVPVRCLQNKTNPTGWITAEDWIKWASGVWTDILQTDILDGWKSAREHDEEKHVCLARGSLILTKRGYVPIEQVEIGDKVLTHLGRWRPVITKAMTGTNKTVKVKAQGVHDLTMTPTHKVWARNPGECSKPKDRAKRAEPEWIEARNLKKTYVNMKLPPEEIPGPDALTDQEWWLVGRWLADGHIDSRGALHISVGPDKLKEFLHYAGDLAGTTRLITSYQVRIKDRSGRLRKVISKCGKGALEKQLPPEAFTLPEAEALCLLNGYLSGDGHFNEDRNRWYATSISKKLLLGLEFLILRVHGEVASLHAGRSPGKTTIEGREVSTQQEWVLSWGGVSHSFSFIADDGAWKKVKSVEDGETQETWSLEVEQDNSYTAEGCIVKNCPLQLELIRRFVLLYTNPISIQPDVTVLDPFTGIGSTQFICLGGPTARGETINETRNAIGFELKESYYGQAVRNAKKARKLAKEIKERGQLTLAGMES